MCFLKIFSEVESFEPYAARTQIPVFKIHNRGDTPGRRIDKSQSAYRISFDVSDREWDDLPGQITDAIAFLEQHGSEIRSLIDSHPVSDAYLDFPVYSRLDGEIVSFTDHLPKRLVSLCAQAGLGIAITQYS